LSVQTHESSVNAADRRQTPRTKLVEIAYIGMGPENGGLVLDVSDGGLSFHAVAPVQPAEKIRFLLSLRGHSRIEGAGEVVWTNEMGTVCGLRFTSLSGGALEHLNNWTNQSRMARKAVPPRGKTVAPAPPAVSAASDTRRSLPGAAPVFAIPPTFGIRSSKSMAVVRWQNPKFFWPAFGVLAAALAVTAFIYGIHVGKSKIRSVAQSAAARELQGSPQLDASTSVPASPIAGSAQSAPDETPAASNDVTSAASSALVNASKTEAISGNTAHLSGDEATIAPAPDQHAEKDSDAGKSELAAALAQLNGDNGSRDTPSAVRHLWAAVGKGNTEAEVTLADLYVYGDGVEKNCEQGRVLLNAALRSGNAQAKVKLDELNANGCP
jgi:hypothetical protein